MRVSKISAAERQLDSALLLFLEGGDIVACHTLAGAASVLLSDLVDKHCPEKSWDRSVQSANSLARNEYFRVLRKSQNFFKHAKNDPDGYIDFEESDFTHVAFLATMNLSELEGKKSLAQSFFQVWYVACYASNLGHEPELVATATKLFGVIEQLSYANQREVAIAKWATASP